MPRAARQVVGSGGGRKALRSGRFQPLFATRVKARSLAYVFATAAAISCLVLFLPSDVVKSEGALVASEVATLALAAALFAGADRIRRWQLHVALVAGVAIQTVAVYEVSAAAGFGLLPVWFGLYAFAFFRLGPALAYLGLIGVGWAIVLDATAPENAVVRWILVVGTPLVVGLLVQRLLTRLGDESARRRAEAESVGDSEARTRQILESAPDAFVAIALDGEIVGWNAAAARMFGWTAAEALGRDLASLLIPPEARADHFQRRAAMFEADEGDVTGRRNETDLLRRDGDRFPAEITSSRIVAGGRALLASFVRDLSDQRRREQERAELFREQAARAEAERVAEMVAGMQLLVDAALAHHTLDEMLRDLLPRVRGVLEADEATVLLAEEDGTLVVRGTTAPVDDPEPVRIPPGEGFAGSAAAERRPLLVHDPEPGDPSLGGRDASSMIGVPLLAGGAVTGVIQVAARGGRRFRDEDLGVLRLAADRVALAIDHARVFEREHRIAETLQRSLLPERLPRLPGLAAAARYLPAAAEAEVGGDWYDVIPIPGGSVGLVMGDVAGKGLAAASMVGRLRSALRAYALEGHEPATVVERLNRLVWTELEDSQMATLAYAVFDPVEGRLEWVNAGHLPPLLAPPDGPPELLDGESSVPLGVMPFPTYRAEARVLEQGATVLLYTDGLVERPGSHLDDGFAALRTAVAGAPSGPEQLCDHVLRQLVPRGAASDDVAILALRNTPVSDRFTVELPAQPESLSAVRSLLRRWLRNAEASDAELAEVTMACGEACTNAIEHSGSGGMPFEVDGRLEGGTVEVVVRDFGSWRPEREDDQGRGLELMRALVDSVELTPSPEGTTVKLRRRLAAAVKAS